MAFGHLWAGRIYGTNIGNVFVKFDKVEGGLVGKLHFNDAGVGFVIYSIEGSFDGNRLAITGATQTQTEGVVFGDLRVNASLTSRGELIGEWNTSVGAAGTLVLYPHNQDQPADVAPLRVPDQLYTSRYHFGAIEVDRDQITALADDIQSDFKAGLVVTVVAGTERSRFLSDFKSLSFNQERATIIKLFVQEKEESGVNRVVSVDFGPQVNALMTQGGDEAWVLGMLEKIKREIVPFEKTYITNFKKLGIGINQILLGGVLIFLPSLTSIMDRAILCITVFTLIFSINWIHSRYLPFAVIYLSKRPPGLSTRIRPVVLSWATGVSASIVATLLAAYLKGWLKLN